MPAILERLVGQLQDKGYSKSSAFAIATKSLQKAGDLKPGSQDRAVKYSKGKRSPSDYNYNSTTNRATLKSNGRGR